MARPRKYRKGPLIGSMCELSNELSAQRWVYWGKRPVHPAWLGSMHWFTLRQIVMRNQFHYAIRNEQEPKP